MAVSDLVVAVSDLSRGLVGFACCGGLVLPGLVAWGFSKAACGMYGCARVILPWDDRCSKAGGTYIAGPQHSSAYQ